MGRQYSLIQACIDLRVLKLAKEERQAEATRPIYKGPISEPDNETILGTDTDTLHTLTKATC